GPCPCPTPRDGAVPPRTCGYGRQFAISATTTTRSRSVGRSEAGSEVFDHVVHACGQCGDVVGVHGRVHADPDLIAAELAVGLHVHHTVLAQHLADPGSVEVGGELDGAHHR